MAILGEKSPANEGVNANGPAAREVQPARAVLCVVRVGACVGLRGGRRGGRRAQCSRRSVSRCMRDLDSTTTRTGP